MVQALRQNEMGLPVLSDIALRADEHGAVVVGEVALGVPLRHSPADVHAVFLRKLDEKLRGRALGNELGVPMDADLVLAAHGYKACGADAGQGLLGQHNQVAGLLAGLLDEIDHLGKVGLLVHRCFEVDSCNFRHSVASLFIAAPCRCAAS